MATFFLIIIYISFISLGLPDSLLGVAWPLMQSEYGAPFEAAGLVSMLISGSTVISSMASGIVHKHLSTGKITFLSCLMTALSLLGFSLSQSLVWLIFLAIPLGLGAGSVDAALNNYVATHYKSRHMSWLHCFWGVGAALGPVIMSQYIARQNSWRGGYLTVSLFQMSLAVLLFFSLPLWKRADNKLNSTDEAAIKSSEGSENDVPNNMPDEVQDEVQEKRRLLQKKSVKFALVSFLFYCGIETTVGLWGSSFLINVRGLPTAVAAQWVSMFYTGITAGRFITGFITLKASNSFLIRMGEIAVLSGIILLFIPSPAIFSLIGFIIIGLGCAPIFPCMLHETPRRFGRENTHAIMGYQMAFGYIGSTFLPPILGLIAAHLTIGVLPFAILLYIIITLGSSEKINMNMKEARVKLRKENRGGAA